MAQSELKVEMMNRKQLQNAYNKSFKKAHPLGPSAEDTNFLEKAQKNPNWKYIKAPRNRGTEEVVY